MTDNRRSSGNGNHDWYEKGRRLSRHGGHKDAIEALTEAIKENPLHAEAYFLRGACQYALGNYQDAGKDLDAAAILGCRDAQFWSRHSFNIVAKDEEDGLE